MVAGCEIHDDPCAPLVQALPRPHRPSAATTRRSPGSRRDERYVEKLATPDVTIADMIGDVDPIRAARGGHDLSSELTMHYGLLPRAHRGIFALNELPDLAGRIQVGLFNILQEGDVQIKGYPVRLPLDVCMVFTANPEDYTARGKIITPLKDRIGSEIRTHYPAHHRAGRRHHAAGGLDRPRGLERARAALHARGGGGRRLRRAPRQADRQAQRRQPAPAHQRRWRTRSPTPSAAPCARKEEVVVPRISDLYAALPALTGKLELEYEGELMGAENVGPRADPRGRGRGLLACTSAPPTCSPWSRSSRAAGSLKLREDASADGVAGASCGACPACSTTWSALGAAAGEPAPVRAAAAEFVLEGLYAQKKIGRTDDRGFVAPSSGRRRPTSTWSGWSGCAG